MTETEGRRWFKKLMRPYTEAGALMLQPVESPSTGIGIPDWWYRTTHSEGWIEEKEIKSIREVVKVPWRPGQFEWMRNYVKLGGHGLLFVFVATSTTRELVVFKGQDIRREYSAYEFRQTAILARELFETTASRMYELLKNYE